MGCGCGGNARSTTGATSSTIKYALVKADGTTTEPVDTRDEAEKVREPGDRLRVMRVTD